MKRTERLFAISEVLRASQVGLTAQQLATRFDVSLRTIYRDLDALRQANFPLLAEAGPGGGYALDPGYRLPPINFTAREAALLVSAAEWLRRYRLIPFLTTLDQAVTKVRRAMPRDSLRQLQPLVDSLSFVGVPSRPVAAEVQRCVEKAWYEGLPLRILYEGRERWTERLVMIRNVVLDRAEVLLNTTDLELDEPRQLKLHRIHQAQLAYSVGGPPPS